MMTRGFKITIIFNTLLLVAIAVFLATTVNQKASQVYVVNSEIFEGFKGKDDLNKKLSFVKESHQRILDSLYLQVENSNDTKDLEQLREKSRKFTQDEKELTDRYTQQIWKQINSYVDEYGRENSYDMILGANGTGSLMYAKDAINMTDEVLQYINKKYEGEQ